MNEKGLRIGFIGVGVLGKGLALALSALGFKVLAAHSRSPASSRWLAERLIGGLKEFRPIATRYDKLAQSFRTFVIIAFIRIWTQYLLLDTP